MVTANHEMTVDTYAARGTELGTRFRRELSCPPDPHSRDESDG